MLHLVVSDFHLGKGRFLPNGEENSLEDFLEDEEFVDFIDHYSTGTYYFSDVHLILNGDILNLIEVDVNGEFTHFLTEDILHDMVEEIIKGHADFFTSLKKFLGRPNKKITYVIGNHDLGVVFPRVQELLNQAVNGEINFVDVYISNGMLVEHGHRFEPLNTVPRSKQIVNGPEGIPILNLPWASLFCIYLLPMLKKERPFIDKVRPLSNYLRWTIIHDFLFFIKLIFKVFIYITRTQFPPYTSYNKNFKLGLREILKISIHPKYDKFAKRIFDTRDDIKLVIMGHTHIAEWRRYQDGKLYINSGTWNQVTSMNAGLYKNISDLNYVAVETNDKKGTIENASLKVWLGKWKPYRDEVAQKF